MTLGINKIGSFPYSSHGGGGAGFGGLKTTEPGVQPTIKRPEQIGSIGAEGTSSPYINNRDLVSSIGKINGEFSPNISGGNLANRLDFLA